MYRGKCNMENNGLILNSYFVPPEILAHILSYVDPKDLVFNCRFVCKNWNQMVIDGNVWKLKVLTSKYKSLSKLSDGERTRLQLPWHVYYHICSKDPFEKNLLLNNCGQNELLHWYCPSNNKKFSFILRAESEPRYRDWEEQCWQRSYRTDGRSGVCVIEPHPIGVDILPDSDDFGDHKSCFVTSCTACEKEQTIDLLKNGLSTFILDTMQPKIIASEWITGRFDQGFQYKLTVSLIASDGESVIQQKEAERISREPWGRGWEKVSLEFENYGPGVKFVKFKHRGRDSSTWAGFYGAKMAGGVVMATLSNLTDSVSWL